MKTLQIKAYTFEELSPEAKEKALDWGRDLNTEFDWYQYTIEDWKERLSEKGYMDAEIQFSGFGSQGDGASFTAQIDLVKWININLDTEFLKLLPFIENDEITAYITRIDRHYSHKNTCRARVEVDHRIDLTEIQALACGLEAELEKDRLKLCEEIYSELKQEYDDLRRDGAVAETITANEYLFTEDGKRQATL